MSYKDHLSRYLWSVSPPAGYPLDRGIDREVRREVALVDGR